MFEIESLGFHGFMVDTITAIKFITELGGVGGLAGVVLVIYFGMTIIKSGLDDKSPNPLKELLIGGLMVMMFVGPAAPTTDVKIRSAYDISSFEIVEDVPLLVVFPYWIANQGLAELSDLVTTAFSPVQAASLKEADPLQAILKLYNQQPSASLNYGGPSSSQGFDLQKTMSNYIDDCVVNDYLLDGQDPTANMDVLRRTPMSRDLLDELRVDYNGISTVVYLTRNGPESGESLACPDAHTRLVNTISAMDNEIVDWYESTGISTNAVAAGMQLISNSLTTGVSAFELQVGLFTSHLIREGLQNSPLKTEMDLMVFQAQRERMFAKIGERSMILNITRPVYTFLECLVFFITPLYLILLATGSRGLGHIGKYMMLMLFVGLWGFVQIFVDAYTYSTINEVVLPASGFDPLSFDGMPFAMAEIEGAITTAAAASAVVPMIIMFLLYGSVHPLMSAMKGMMDVKGNGNFGAPTVTSPANNGSRDMGTLNITQSAATGNTVATTRTPENEYNSSFSLGRSLSTSTSNAAAEAQSLVTQATESYQTTKSDVMSMGNGVSFTDNQGNSTTLSKMLQGTDSSSAIESIQKQTGMSRQEAEALVTSVGASAALGLQTPKGLPISAGAEVNGKATQSDTDQLIENASKGNAQVEQVLKQYAESISENDQWMLSTNFSDSERAEFAESLTQLQNKGEVVTAATNNSTELKQQVNDAETIQNTLPKLQWSDVQLSSQGFNQVFETLREGFKDEKGNVDDKAFESYLKNEYGTADYDEIRDTIATDKDIMVNGRAGSDGGVLNTLLSDYADITGSNTERLQALGNAFTQIGESQGDTSPGNTFTKIGQEISETVEDINRTNELTERINNDVKAQQENIDVKDGVKTATSDNTPDSLDPDNIRRVDKPDEFNDVKSDLNAAKGQGEAIAQKVQDENKNLDLKVEQQIDENNKPGIDALYNLKNWFTDGFEKEFSFNEATDGMEKLVRNYNGMAIENGGAIYDYNGLSKGFEILENKNEEGGNNLSNLSNTEALQAYMAADFIDQNKELLTELGVSDGFIQQAQGAKSEIAENNFKKLGEDDRQAIDAVSQKVATGQADVSSGIGILANANVFDDGVLDKLKGDALDLKDVTNGAQQNGFIAAQNAIYDYEKSGLNKELAEIYKDNEDARNGLSRYDEVLDERSGRGDQAANSFERLRAADFAYSAANYIDAERRNQYEYDENQNASENFKLENEKAYSELIRGGYSMAMGNYDYVSGVDTLTKVSENENVSLQKVLDSDNRYDPIRENVVSTVDNMNIPTYNTSFGENYEGETRGGLPATTDTNKGEAKIAGVSVGDDGAGMAYYKIDGMEKTTYQVPVEKSDNGGFNVVGAFTDVKANERADAEVAMKAMTPASELVKGTANENSTQGNNAESMKQESASTAAVTPNDGATPTTENVNSTNANASGDTSQPTSPTPSEQTVSTADSRQDAENAAVPTGSASTTADTPNGGATPTTANVNPTDADAGGNASQPTSPTPSTQPVSTADGRQSAENASTPTGNTSTAEDTPNDGATPTTENVNSTNANASGDTSQPTSPTPSEQTVSNSDGRQSAENASTSTAEDTRTIGATVDSPKDKGTVTETNATPIDTDIASSNDRAGDAKQNGSIQTDMPPAATPTDVNVKDSVGNSDVQETNGPDVSAQEERSVEQPIAQAPENVESTPGISSENGTGQQENTTDPKFRNADFTQQPVEGSNQAPDTVAPSANSAAPSTAKQEIEDQNMMDDFMARGAEKVSALDSVAAENDLEITQNDSGMNVIDVASAPNGEVTIGGAMYQLVGDRVDDTGESIGQLFYDKTSDNYTSVEYGKVVNWGDSNPNKQV